MKLTSKIMRVFVSNDFIRSAKAEVGLVFRRLLCLMPWNLLKIRSAKRRTPLWINLGGGVDTPEGWVNIDLTGPKRGARWDLRWGLPFSNNSVDRIHCEHFLEHLEHPLEVAPFIRECFRVLKPEGDLRLIVPDAEKYMNAYVKNDTPFFRDLKALGGGENLDTPVEIVNQVFRMAGDHRFLYDRNLLEKILRDAGFPSVFSIPYAPMLFADLSDWWRMRESLYLTAYKTKTELRSLYSSASNE